MKECRKIKRLLSRYLDAEISDRDKLLVEKHIAICSLCKNELTELSQIKKIMLEKEKKSLPEDYLVFRLREEISSQRPVKEEVSLNGLGFLSRRFIPVPVATFVVTLGFLFLTSLQPTGSEFSWEDNILKGAPITREAALGLILGLQG